MLRYYHVEDLKSSCPVIIDLEVSGKSARISGPWLGTRDCSRSPTSRIRNTPLCTINPVSDDAASPTKECIQTRTTLASRNQPHIHSTRVLAQTEQGQEKYKLNDLIKLGPRTATRSTLPYTAQLLHVVLHVVTPQCIYFRRQEATSDAFIRCPLRAKRLPPRLFDLCSPFFKL